MKKDLQGILVCCVICLLFWILPAVFSSYLSCSVAEFYIKYRAVGMTMAALAIVVSIQGFHRLHKGKNKDE